MPSVRSFVSHIRRNMLVAFLARHELELPAEILKRDHTVVADAIDAMLADAAPGTRSRLMKNVEHICEMGKSAGAAAIGSLTLPDEIAGLESAQERALWLWLNDPERYRHAMGVRFADKSRFGKSWVSYQAPSGKVPNLGAEAIARLKAEFRRAFDTKNIHIEVFGRTRATFSVDGENGPDELVQLTIYREGPPNSENAFVDGELTTATRRPVIDSAVTYDQATGCIECVAAKKEDRSAIVKAFGILVLGCSQDFDPMTRRTYDLTVLVQPQRFDVEPGDRIEKVCVSMMRLLPTALNTERVIVETDPRDGRDIWTVIEDRLGTGVLGSQYAIEQARIVVDYRDGESNRARRLPITITHPHRSDLREKMSIERAISKKYLPLWGLVTTA